MKTYVFRAVLLRNDSRLGPCSWGGWDVQSVQYNMSAQFAYALCLCNVSIHGRRREDIGRGRVHQYRVGLTLAIRAARLVNLIAAYNCSPCERCGCVQCGRRAHCHKFRYINQSIGVNQSIDLTSSVRFHWISCTHTLLGPHSRLHVLYNFGRLATNVSFIILVSFLLSHTKYINTNSGNMY